MMSNDTPVADNPLTPPSTPESECDCSEWIGVNDIQTAEVMTLSEIKKICR